MILCIDCGNTRLKWGIWHRQAWLARGACLHAEIDRLAGLCAEHPALEQAFACNVAGPEIAAKITQTLPLPLHWLCAQAEQCGVRNAYERPAQLGADRWAALLAARRQHAGASLVVNAGTATTIDSLDADGIFRGGMILPGVSLMRDALSTHTAQLPLAAAAYAAFPRNTETAIASGTLEATLGAIERCFTRLQNLAEAPALCIVSGGAAADLVPLLTLPARHVEALVLEGIAVVATSAKPCAR